MIFKILFNYLLGFVNITVEGFFVERFINNCINNKIFLWSIKRKSSTLMTTNVNINDFKKIHKISNKTKCRVKINSKNGLPIILHRYRKRKLLVVLLIPIIFSIILSSQYVWNIDINGIETIDKEELINQLKDEGIYIGNRKSNINSKDIINNIRIKRDDISWMSIEIKGTNIKVSVVEAELKPSIINKNEYCNIVASKSGLITKITADNGTAIAKVGDIVSSGDILIAGYMEGKYTGIRNVHAQGSVEAKVWYTKKIESSNIREETIQTGKQEIKYSINFNNFKINLYKSDTKFKNYDTICETKKIKLFSNFYLPIEINKVIYLEEQKEKIKYETKELENLLISELEQEFNNDEISNLNVINKIVNRYNKGNNILELEMTYEVVQEIGTEEKFE